MYDPNLDIEVRLEYRTDKTLDKVHLAITPPDKDEPIINYMFSSKRIRLVDSSQKPVSRIKLEDFTFVTDALNFINSVRNGHDIQFL